MKKLTLDQFRELAEKYNAINSDWDRLQFLKDNKGHLKAVLDNDHTAVVLCRYDHLSNPEKDVLYDFDINSFDDYHYWSEGCLLLFKFAGIDAESC